MAEAVVDTIGVVSGVLGIVSFFQGLFPSSPPTSYTSPAGPTVLRIGAAQDGQTSGGTLKGAQGRIGQINLYNENRDRISANPYETALNPSGYVGQNSFTDFSMDCQGQQPTYIQIFGNEDAICIPYIMHTWPDGTKRGWSGDIGMLCGVNYWGYSNVIVGRIGDTNYKPACTWLDWDHSGGLQISAMQIHISEFFIEDATNSTSLDKSKYCNPPEMIWQSGHPNPDDWMWSESYQAQWNGAIGQKQRRRAIRKRSPQMEAQLILSTEPSHSATQLCEHDMSHSADFVSLDEGLFCDMGTKTLWPLCTETTVDNCFNESDTTLKVHGKSQQRTYADVVKWD